MATQDEKELKQLFSRWAEAASKKDVDGAMEPVARNVVSYEHEGPLEHDGVEAVREVCRKGLEHTEGFRWDVPDLRIVVRDDLAVTWGLNRMQSKQGVRFSRGTRVFQKIDGRWQMIHQHVSVPYDPATGKAVVNARPSHGRS